MTYDLDHAVEHLLDECEAQGHPRTIESDEFFDLFAAAIERSEPAARAANDHDAARVDDLTQQ